METFPVDPFEMEKTRIVNGDERKWWRSWVVQGGWMVETME